MGGRPGASGTVRTMLARVWGAVEGGQGTGWRGWCLGTVGKRPFTRSVQFLLTCLWISPSAKANPAVHPADRFGRVGSWL